MTLSATELQARAKKKQQALQRRRRNPRFLRTMGKLVTAKLLQTNIKTVVPFHGDVHLDDALWAGATEPRVLELLPAIVLKKPGLFQGCDELPVDLGDIVHAIRRGEATAPFRGIQATDYLPWVKRIGHKGKAPTLLKSFRMQQDDIALLRRLKTELATTEIDVIRRALNALERAHQ